MSEKGASAPSDEQERARVARTARNGRGKVHWVAVTGGHALRYGEPIPPEGKGRTLCGAHYFATGWTVVGSDDYASEEFCRACDR